LQTGALEPTLAGMEGPPATVTTHDSERGHWRNVRRRPDPRLRAYVADYQDYEQVTSVPVRERHMPHGAVTVIINFGPNLRTLDPRDLEAPPFAPDAFVAGLNDSYAISESVGVSRGIQLDFTPIGARLFFGVPLDALFGKVVDLGDVLGAPGRRLVDQLRETRSFELRFALVDEAIASRLAEGRTVSPAVAWAWQRLTETHGRIEVGSLAAGLGWSRKHLAAQFREQIGAPPKLVARLLRFRRAVRLLDRVQSGRWAEIAYCCGYYDQAHFIRDFRQFAGGTPTDYLARRLPGQLSIDGS
jgi:AraC-like DNA-binding protein